MLITVTKSNLYFINIEEHHIEHRRTYKIHL